MLGRANSFGAHQSIVTLPMLLMQGLMHAAAKRQLAHLRRKYIEEMARPSAKNEHKGKTCSDANLTISGTPFRQAHLLNRRHCADFMDFAKEVHTEHHRT